MATPVAKFRLVFRPSPGSRGVVWPMLKQGVWMLATVPAVVAGWTDWRCRRIPNWLTVPALVAGNCSEFAGCGLGGSERIVAGSWAGVRAVVAFCADTKPGRRGLEAGGRAGCVSGTVAADYSVAGDDPGGGIDGGVLMIWKKRVGRTARNLCHMVAGLFTLHLPGPEVSLDNPESRRYRLEWRWQ